MVMPPQCPTPQPIIFQKTMEPFEQDEAQVKRSIEDYNRRAKSQKYRTWTFEEVLDLIASAKAVICEFCGMLVLGGKHNTYYYNYGRHLQFSSNCLRIRLSNLEAEINRDWEVNK